MILNPLAFVNLNTVGAIMGTTAARITKSNPLYFCDVYKMKAVSAKNRAGLKGAYYFAYFMYILSKKYDLYFLFGVEYNQDLSS